MTNQCYYCGRWFPSKQSLRGHLGNCPARNRPREYIVGTVGVRTIVKSVKIQQRIAEIQNIADGLASLDPPMSVAEAAFAAGMLVFAREKGLELERFRIAAHPTEG